ncbi:MAG: methyltransferase domain-containing protein [Deltaproteobacteria bacterium]|nr:methyltransferase domain-containing protein [Deltaproteobacteria bacterium]
MTTAVDERASTALVAPTPVAVAPNRWRLLYSPWAWRQWIRWKSEVIRTAHTERVYAQLAPHIPDASRVLDVGAWDGRLGRLLRDRKRCDVILTDVVDKNATDLPLRVFDGTTLPLDDGTRDVVLFVYVLHHAADDLALLREARRVCAAGGRVVVAEDQVETRRERIITIGFHVWLFTVTLMGWRGQFRRAEAWRARFAEAGLTVDEVVPLGAPGRLWPKNMLLIARR